MDTFNEKMIVEADKLIISDIPKKVFVKSDSKLELISENSEKNQPNQIQPNQVQSIEIQPNERKKSRKQTITKRESYD